MQVSFRGRKAQERYGVAVQTASVLRRRRVVPVALNSPSERKK
jgi:hypothetical protein